MKYLLLALLTLTLISCSGLIGGDIVISIPQLASDARYISSEATSGFVVLMKEDKVYSLNNYENEIFQKILNNGYVRVDNLLPGTYILGIALFSETDDNYGLVIKEVKVEQGYNSYSVLVDPGITDFNIGGVGVDNIFQPDNFEVSFRDNEVNFTFQGSPSSYSIGLDYGDGVPFILTSNFGLVNGVPGTFTVNNNSFSVTSGITYNINFK